jgi:hypothetical protein
MLDSVLSDDAGISRPFIGALSSVGDLVGLEH